MFEKWKKRRNLISSWEWQRYIIRSVSALIACVFLLPVSIVCVARESTMWLGIGGIFLSVTLSVLGVFLIRWAWKNYKTAREREKRIDQAMEEYPELFKESSDRD